MGWPGAGRAKEREKAITTRKEVDGKVD